MILVTKEAAPRRLVWAWPARAAWPHVFVYLRDRGDGTVIIGAYRHNLKRSLEWRSVVSTTDLEEMAAAWCLAFGPPLRIQCWIARYFREQP